jgi:hypothetical protein
VAKKNGSEIGFPCALFVVLLLAGWAVSLVVSRPTVVFHGGPRWISEDMWAGIPVLVAFALFTAFMTYRWQTRDERKLGRLLDERLRAEGKHPTQLRIEREKEQKRQAAELKKQAAELKKQQVREEIKREEHLREERLHTEGLA